jgi:hypothetical protein
LMPFLVMDFTRPKKSISRDAYDLSGFYIISTSNIGSQRLLRPTRLPFTTLELAVISELHKFFLRNSSNASMRKWSPSYLPRTHNARSPSSPKPKNSSAYPSAVSISWFPTRHSSSSAGAAFHKVLGPLEENGAEVHRPRDPRCDESWRASSRRSRCFALQRPLENPRRLQARQ